MNAFNLYGLVLMAAMMAPNIIFAVKCKDGLENLGGTKRLLCVAFVGVSRTNAKRLKKALRGATFTFGFENDFEEPRNGWFVNKEEWKDEECGTDNRQVNRQTRRRLCKLRGRRGLSQ